MYGRGKEGKREKKEEKRRIDILTPERNIIPPWIKNRKIKEERKEEER